MSKVIGLVEIAVGVALLFVPGGQSFGIQLIIAGVVTEASALLTPSAGGRAKDASEQALQLGEQPRSAVFGEAAVPGSLIDGFNYGGKYGTDWEVLGIRLADHKCASLTGFYVNDQFVNFAGNGPVAGYNGQLEVYFRSDTTTQALPAVVTAHGPGWTADDIGAGGCDVWVCYKADASNAKTPVWPGGRPVFLWVLKGKLCYIARKDSTVPGGSGAHRWNTPATWEWTDNPIDCRYNWARGIFANDQVGNPEMLWVGRGLTAEEAPPENSFAPANLCDELVGGEKRFRVDGIVYANQQYLEIEEMFAAAVGGSIVTREGSVEIEPGQAKSIVATFTDDQIVSATEIQWNEGFLSDADTDWVNTVVPRYVEPTQKWDDHGAPVRRDVADIIADGKPREESVALRLVKRAAQAGRVGEYVRRLGRLWGRGGVVLPPRFCELEEGDWVAWTSARRFGGATKTFRIDAYEIGLDWQNKLQLREIAASVYTEGAALVDGAVADPSDPPPAVGEPDGGAWTLSAEQLGADTQIPALVIEGAVDDPYAESVRFEYRIDDGTDPALAADWISDVPAAPSVTRREITSVASATAYYAAVSYLVAGVPGDRLILGPVTTGVVSGVAVGPDGTTELVLDGGNPAGDPR